MEPVYKVEKSFFNKLLFQGLSMEKTAESNSESEGENLGETAAVQDDMPSEDIAEVNGLALCYFAPAQHIPTPVAAGIPNAEDLAHEIPGQDLRKPDLLVQVPAQDLQQPVEMSEATVEMSGQDTPAPNMRTAAFNQMPEPQVQEPQLFDENTEVQNKTGQYEGHVRRAKAAPGMWRKRFPTCSGA